MFVANQTLSAFFVLFLINNLLNIIFRYRERPLLLLAAFLCGRVILRPHNFSVNSRILE